MRTAFISFFCIAAMSGCATPWPKDMPPTTYSGTVYNESTGKNEANATVRATRLCVTPGLMPGQFFVPMDPGIETIATTRAGNTGDFVLTTSSGYAEVLWAESRDGTMEGGLESNLKNGGKKLCDQDKAEGSYLEKLNNTARRS